MDALGVMISLLQAPGAPGQAGEPAQAARPPGEAVNGMQDFLAVTFVILLLLILIAILIALLRQRAR